MSETDLNASWSSNPHKRWMPSETYFEIKNLNYVIQLNKKRKSTQFIQCSLLTCSAFKVWEGDIGKIIKRELDSPNYPISEKKRVADSLPMKVAVVTVDPKGAKSNENVAQSATLQPVS